jgi:hypothetical protein
MRRLPIQETNLEVPSSQERMGMFRHHHHDGESPAQTSLIGNLRKAMVGVTKLYQYSSYADGIIEVKQDNSRHFGKQDEVTSPVTSY